MTGDPKRIQPSFVTGASSGMDDSPAMAAPSREGELLDGKYLIGPVLGSGGMGAVYEAHHTVVGRPFAIKFLHTDLSRRPDMVERFRREAMICGTLVSEHLAAVFDFGVAEDGAPFLVMERLVGEDLGRRLRSGPWSAEAAASLAIQACRGLDKAHQHGLIHRDLKPQNLFLCRRADGSEVVKLLDFGIAKLHASQPGSDSVPETMRGVVLGTPHYMAPEQARGARDIDHRADIYALGVILYEVLTGRRPHPGNDFHEILYHILTYPPQPLASLRPDLSGALCDLIHRTMAYDPADRPQSASELAALMACHVSGSQRDLPAATQWAAAGSPVGRVLSPSAPTPTRVRSTATQLPSANVSSPGRLRRRFMAVAVLAAVGGAGWIWRSGGRPSPLQSAPTSPLPSPSPSPSPPAFPVTPAAVPTIAAPAESAAARARNTQVSAAPPRRAARKLPATRPPARSAPRSVSVPASDRTPPPAQGPLPVERSNPYER